MQKYIDNLDDFEDDSRPPLIDWVEWLLVGIFDLAGAGACAYIGYLLLVLVVEGRWIGGEKMITGVPVAGENTN